MTQDPNATQVGGQHYRTQYQHWDFVADLNLNYYLANITKYVARAYKKNGLEDVHKAQHYAAKLHSLLDSGRLSRHAVVQHTSPAVAMGLVERFAAANELDTLQEQVYACAVLVTGHDVTQFSYLQGTLQALEKHVAQWHRNREQATADMKGL